MSTIKQKFKKTCSPFAADVLQEKKRDLKLKITRLKKINGVLCRMKAGRQDKAAAMQEAVTDLTRQYRVGYSGRRNPFPL